MTVHRHHRRHGLGHSRALVVDVNLSGAILRAIATGTRQVGQTLTAALSDGSDLTGAAFSWKRDAGEVGTSQPFALTEADALASTFTVTITPSGGDPLTSSNITIGWATPAWATIDPITAIEGAGNLTLDLATYASVTGDADGSTLTYSIVDADGTGATIASGSVLTISRAAVLSGNVVVRVTTLDGKTADATVAASITVAPAVAITATAAPALLILMEGNEISLANASQNLNAANYATDAAGETIDTVTATYSVNGGAQSATYEPVDGDVIVATVTVTDTGGNSEAFVTASMTVTGFVWAADGATGLATMTYETHDVGLIRFDYSDDVGRAGSVHLDQADFAAGPVAVVAGVLQAGVSAVDAGTVIEVLSPVFVYNLADDAGGITIEHRVSIDGSTPSWISGAGPSTYDTANDGGLAVAFEYRATGSNGVVTTITNAISVAALEVITNLLTAPNDFTNAAWIASTNSSKIDADTIRTQGTSVGVYQNVTVTTGEEFNVSFVAIYRPGLHASLDMPYAYSNIGNQTGNFAGVYRIDDPAQIFAGRNGTSSVNAEIQYLGTNGDGYDEYRCSYAWTATATSTARIRFQGVADDSATDPADGYLGIRAAQMTAGLNLKPIQS